MCGLYECSCFCYFHFSTFSILFHSVVNVKYSVIKFEYFFPVYPLGEYLSMTEIGKVHFAPEQVKQHDSEIVIQEKGENILDVHLGMYKF